MLFKATTLFFAVCLIGVLAYYKIAPTYQASQNPQTGVIGLPQEQDGGIKPATLNTEQNTSLQGSSEPITLPLGDSKYTLDGPKKGYIYLCRQMMGGGGAQAAGPWIAGTTWSPRKKISINGAVTWPNAKFDLAYQGAKVILSGNGLPSHVTGVYPVASNDAAYLFDRNPNSIRENSFSLELPSSPQVTDSAYCIGGEVGVMLTGVRIYNGFDAQMRDAQAHEIQDACDGHPQKDGVYHYHGLSRCISGANADSIIGYALDGFPITGNRLADGTYLQTSNLDDCHGITSEVVVNGKSQSMYHYVLTHDFPYSVGCFRGRPVSLQVGTNTEFGGMSGRGSEDRGAPGGGPPQGAITACQSLNEGQRCSFATPDSHTITGTCRTPPQENMVLCVPER